MQPAHAVLSRESISSVYAVVIPIRPLFATSSFALSTGIHILTPSSVQLCAARAVRVVFDYIYSPQGGRLCRPRAELSRGATAMLAGALQAVALPVSASPVCRSSISPPSTSPQQALGKLLPLLHIITRRSFPPEPPELRYTTSILYTNTTYTIYKLAAPRSNHYLTTFSRYNTRLLRQKAAGACLYMPKDGHWLASFEVILPPQKVGFSAAKI